MSNKQIDDLVKDGFSFASPNAKYTELSLLSLKIALESFSNTYNSVVGDLDLLEDGDATGFRASAHSIEYRQSYAECIVHFQHFAELVCKDILRKIHPLLSVDASPKPIIYYKLLKGEEIKPTDWEQLKSIEFSEVLRRTKGLVSEGRLPAEVAFFSDFEHALSKLNELRNRIWHRGTYILHYPALDKFITQHIIPYALAVLSLQEYQNKDRLWKYKKLHSNIDPILELNNQDTSTYDIGKVAFLKELMRAAYKNPLLPVPGERRFGRSSIIEHNSETKRRTEQLALAREKLGGVWGIRQCIVCGMESLLLYTTTETEVNEIGEEHEVMSTSAANCLGCTFSVNNELDNPREYGINTDDYWFTI